jgi:uncharacterized surface protein with fasciclin (FAS1) repeats
MSSTSAAVIVLSVNLKSKERKETKKRYDRGHNTGHDINHVIEKPNMIRIILRFPQEKDFYCAPMSNSRSHPPNAINMKTAGRNLIPISFLVIAMLATSLSLPSCSSGSSEQAVVSTAVAAAPGAGQSAVQDTESKPDVVRVAVGSADHTTLVAALKAAEYVDALSNAGPFTVFAPTNAAFENLPPGTVEGLLEPDRRDDLRNILEYHVAVGVYKLENLVAGQTINQVNLENVTITVTDGKYMVNGANIMGTVMASNGVVYVIDAVLLPPTK